MHLGLALESLYILSSFWGGPATSPVCTRVHEAASRATAEAPRARGPRVAAGVTAFVKVNVVPMDAERVLADHTVLVEGARSETRPTPTFLRSGTGVRTAAAR